MEIAVPAEGRVSDTKFAVVVFATGSSVGVHFPETCDLSGYTHVRLFRCRRACFAFVDEPFTHDTEHRAVGIWR